MNLVPIGLSGAARSGKDTAFKIIQNLLAAKEIKAKRFALADELKFECDDALKDMFGISAFTTDTKEKEIIRPFLVFYGKQKRIESQGQHWCSLLHLPILASLKFGEVPVVTDIRYNEYENDEVSWIKSFGGKIIYIEMIQSNGTIRQGANKDEIANNEIIRSKADYIICWPEIKDSDNLLKELSPYVEKALSAIL